MYDKKHNKLQKVSPHWIIFKICIPFILLAFALKNNKLSVVSPSWSDGAVCVQWSSTAVVANLQSVGQYWPAKQFWLAPEVDWKLLYILTPDLKNNKCSQQQQKTQDVQLLTSHTHKIKNNNELLNRVDKGAMIFSNLWSCKLSCED